MNERLLDVGLPTAEIRRRLHVRYAKQSDAVGVPEYLVLDEVTIDSKERWADLHPHLAGSVMGNRPATKRRLDVIAVGMWASTNYDVHGIEIKASRADWLKELRDRRKADAAVRYCDFFWVAVGDREIVKPYELPEGWGLLIPHGRALRVFVQADRLDRRVSPRFVASLLACATTQHHSCRNRAYLSGRNDERFGIRLRRWA